MKTAENYRLRMIYSRATFYDVVWAVRVNEAMARKSRRNCRCLSLFNFRIIRRMNVAFFHDWISFSWPSGRITKQNKGHYYSADLTALVFCC